MYFNLEIEMKKRKITRSKIAKDINLAFSSVSLKLKEKYPFTLREAQRIKKLYFPDLSIEYLFEEEVTND